jgi:hypothetical protein
MDKGLGMETVKGKKPELGSAGPMVLPKFPNYRHCDISLLI